MSVQTPNFRLEYAGKDITQDISRYATNISYTDAVSGESDEIQVTLQDLEGLWRSSWRPNKGDKISLWLGYGQNLVKCGTFEVDEIELSGPPDTVNFRGLATPVSSPLRTKNSKAYENLTLQNIVNDIAVKYGLTVQGNIPAITIPRATQGKETDLAFLNRIAQEYFMLFSIRDSVLTFTQITEIEKNAAVFDITRTDCISYSLNDKTVDVTNEAKTGATDALSGKFIAATSAADTKYYGTKVVVDQFTAWDTYRKEIMTGVFSVAYINLPVANAFPKDLFDLFDLIYDELQDGYITAQGLAGRSLSLLANRINRNVNESQRFIAAWKQYISPDYGKLVKDATDNVLRKIGEVVEKENAYLDAYNERARAQTQQIADYRANALSYVKKVRQVTGRITTIGNNIALAGNNFNLVGFGRYDGICHIEKSTHNLSRSGGYVTDIEFKLIRQ